MGKSSKDKRDAYYRLAKEQGWRARSAYKLIQLDEQFDLFRDVSRVVDLCAAPGSWSQVLSRVLIKGEKFGRRAWEDKHTKLVSDFASLGTEQEKIGEAAATESQNRSRDEVLTTAKGGEGGVCAISTVRSNDLSTSIVDNLTNDSAAIPLADVKTAEPTTTPPTKESDLQPRSGVRIVSVDLQPMSPLEGITTLVGDITHPSTIPRILAALDPDTYDEATSTGSSPVDLVVSDGAPDVTGLHDLDVYVQAQLLFSALDLAIRVLRPGGSFVAKIFRARDVDLIYAQLRCFFRQVYCAKPRSSRASSLEAFVVCRDFHLPKGYDLNHGRPLGQGADLSEQLAQQHDTAKAGSSSKGPFVNGQRRTLRSDGVVELEFEDEEAEANRWIAPFVACGDLSAFDSDATYHLPKDHVALDPVQPPTAPPYKRALELRRQMGGFYGKTGKRT